MDTSLIIVIILLVVLIAGGIYMLTRNPAPRRGDGPPVSDSPQGADPEVDRYDVGGEHVAAGDAEASIATAPYDQEADAGRSEYEHDGETHVEPATVDQTVSQDTATGAEVEIVEEEPVVRANEDLDPVDAPADPYDHGDQEQMTYGQSQTEDYAAETTYAQPVPHEQDVQPAAEDDLDGRSADELIGAPPGGQSDGPRGGATVMGGTGRGEDQESNAHGGPTDGQHRDDPNGDRGGRASENPGPEDGEGDVDEREVDQGHPGPASQAAEDATYDGPLSRGEAGENPGPEAGEGDVTPPSDQGHPGHESHPGDEATYDQDHTESATAESGRVSEDDPEVVVIDQQVESQHISEGDAAAGLDSTESTSTMVNLENEDSISSTSDSKTAVADPETDGGGGGSTVITATGHQSVVEQREAPAEVDEADEVDPDSDEDLLAHETDSDDVESVSEEGPYGPGSAMPQDDGSGPSGFEIKGNAGSMLFHTPDSPAYEDCRAEVWFDGQDAARDAGFAHWDRKQR